MIPFVTPPQPLSMFGLSVSIFGLFAFAAVIVTYAAIVLRAGRVALARRHEVDRFAQVTLLGGLLGAHTGGILLEHGLAALSRPSLFLSARGSLSSAGGLVAAALVACLHLAAKKRDLLAWADVVAWALPFGLFVARAGCALAHDHPGVLSSSVLAVRFPEGARLDCGLLEALWALVLVLLAVALVRRPSPKGHLAAAIGAGYCGARFALDFLRARDLPLADARIAALTFAQWLSLPVLAACALLLARGRLALHR